MDNRKGRTRESLGEFCIDVSPVEVLLHCTFTILHFALFHNWTRKRHYAVLSVLWRKQRAAYTNISKTLPTMAETNSNPEKACWAVRRLHRLGVGWAKRSLTCDEADAWRNIVSPGITSLPGTRIVTGV